MGMGIEDDHNNPDLDAIDGSDGNATAVRSRADDDAPNNDTVFENEIQPRVDANTAENVTVPTPSAIVLEPAAPTLKCRAFPHGLYSVVIVLWSTFAWLM